MEGAFIGRMVLVGAIVAFIGLAIVAVQIGGLPLRNTVVQTEQLALQLSQPVTPGVPVTVRWDVPADVDVDATQQSTVTAWWRIDGSEQVGVAQPIPLTAGQLQVLVPCTIPEESTDTVSLLIRNQIGSVLANTPISMLPPGNDCF